MTKLKFVLKLISSHRNKANETTPAVYEVNSYAYDFEKPADRNGEITGSTRGGNIRVETAGYPPTALLHWAFTPYRLMDGEIILYDETPEKAKEKITFENARCVAFHLGYDAMSGKYLLTLLTIKATGMNVGDSNYSE